uniref:Uncharacterized protein n=1 Tax=Leersia perrieri TaxID=77586 RepID=A0A0D9VBY6_9ORYZ
MADKPSRGLVLYAAGHAALLPTASGGGGGGNHLDAFASLASCGFLSLRTPPPSGGGEGKCDSTILELAQLLDVYDDLFPAKNEETGGEIAQLDPQQLAVPKLSESKLGKLGMKTDLNRLDKLVGAIMEAAPISSAIASRIHVSVILSYGSTVENKNGFSISNSSTETDSDLNLLRPRQSYTMKAGNILDNVRNHHPMLLAQWQEGVTRSDLTKGFTFEEFIKRGGNLAMLAERFLHEVAFKLWKAPKYGA